MNKRVALFLAVIGAVVIALAVVDYVLTRKRAQEAVHETVELIQSYRAGSAERPFEEELDLIMERLDRATGRALLRMQVAGLLGVIILATGLVFLVSRQERAA